MSSEKEVFRQNIATGSGQRWRTLAYKVLDDYNPGSCRVYTISVPDIQESCVVPVFNTNDKSARYYHTTEKKEIVEFEVVYIPLNNSSGKGLFKKAKELIYSVLTGDFNPEVATINILRNGVIEKTIIINDTIIVSGEIIVDLHDFVRIRFVLSGILADS
jgi:hypothetical protein